MTTIVTPNLNDAITAAQSYAAAAASSATAAATSATNAGTTAVNTFNNHFYGLLASDPATRPDTTATQPGDFYFNTTVNALKMFITTNWQVVAVTPLSAAGALLAGNNLGDLASPSAARANLGLGTLATQNSGSFLQTTSNLSDVSSASVARTNLGLATVAATGSAADLTTGTLSSARLPLPAVGTVGGVFSNAGQTHKFVTAINTDGSVTLGQPSQSDISGLGTAATQNSTAFAQVGNNLSDLSSPSTALINIGGMGQTFFYGDASDGNVTISTSVSLTRDMSYNNLTIAAGAAITTNGFRIYVKGTLDLSAAPSGSFLANGGGGGIPTAGTTAKSTQNIAGGSAGAGGSSSAGSNGTSQTGFGGGGGSGASNSFAGGTGGAMTRTSWVGPLAGWDIGYTHATSTKTAMAGGGGGGGGADAGGGNGGGGGGGGGTIVIVANTIARGSNVNTSIFQAKGGNGASTSGAGGGGGGGGFIFIIVGSLTGSTISSAVDVSSGAGGNGTVAGGGGGGAGAYWILTVSTQTLTENSPTAGNNASGGTGGAAVIQRYGL